MGLVCVFHNLCKTNLEELIANAQLTLITFRGPPILSTQAMHACSLAAHLQEQLTRAACCAVAASGAQHASLQNTHLPVTYINFHSSECITEEIILCKCNSTSKHTS